MTSIFVNIPTNDLDRSIAFYRALGCAINPNFTDENAACVVWSDDIFFMVLRREFFATLHRQAPRRAQGVGTGVAVVRAGLACRRRRDRRGGVAAGGTEPHPAQDYGFMYSRDLDDPDGNSLGFLYMDPVAAEQGPPARPRDARRARSPDHRAVVVIGAVEVEVDDDGDVIARDLTLALVAVDGGAGHRVGEGVRAEDEVDAQALVAGKRSCL
jgi:predicted lactoylglutathione lyase